MRFKEWLKLYEGSRVILQQPVDGIYMIDFRFEDWQPADLQGMRIKNHLKHELLQPKFYGQLPNGQFLIYDGSNASIGVSPPDNIEYISLDNVRFKMPNITWWDYIEAMDVVGNIVKSPKMRRATDSPVLATA